MPRVRSIAFIAAGIVVGLLFARFQAADYLHGSLTLQEGEAQKPLYITPGEGKRTLALSVRNQQDASDLRITVEGGTVISAQPPPLPLPFRHWLTVKDTLFQGLKRGMKFPLTVLLDGKREAYELLFVRAADNRIIQKIPIIRGESHAHH